MRKKIIAGNWKMHLNKAEAIELVEAVLAGSKDLKLGENKIVIFAPPYVYLETIVDKIDTLPNVFVAAQNCSEHEQGAYTGEVAAKMLENLGVQFVIIGHSERRQYFNETDAVLLQKMQQAFSQNIQPIFCCGEPLDIREAEQHFVFIQQQLEHCLFYLSETELLNTVIAYEPIWAIGTGKTASPEQAQEVHHFIRKCIAEKYNDNIAQHISILYGGSVNAQNAALLFSQADIDGGLVGGASLKANDFCTIIKSI